MAAEILVEEFLVGEFLVEPVEILVGEWYLADFVAETVLLPSTLMPILELKRISINICTYLCFNLDYEYCR